MHKALGIQLEVDEFVTFCYELDLRKLRSKAIIFGVIMFVIGFIPPLFFLLWPLAAYGIYKSRKPNANLIAGILLTNKRFIQIHYDASRSGNVIIPIGSIADVDCLRRDVHVRHRRGRTGFIRSLITSWLFTKARNAFQNRKGKMHEGYWQNAKSIVIKYNGAQTHRIVLNKNHLPVNTVSKLGTLLATGREQGWSTIGKTIERVPTDRVKSRPETA